MLKVWGKWVEVEVVAAAAAAAAAAVVWLEFKG